jgi:hypothetical protein
VCALSIPVSVTAVSRVVDIGPVAIVIYHIVSRQNLAIDLNGKSAFLNLGFG